MPTPWNATPAAVTIPRFPELLVRTAELHPGMGHYAEMEKILPRLPEAEILASPPL